jgi:hypothetical protein
MHEDDLHQQIAELVADHGERATPPPVAAIRRRGRLRRARQVSGVALLVTAVATGVVAVQGPLGRQVPPIPVVTEPPPPVVTQPPVPLHPSPSFAAYVRDRFQHKLLDLTVVALTGGKASGYDWQLAAVRGLNPRFAAHQECLVYKTNDPNHSFRYQCLNQSAINKMILDRGMDGRPLWGLVPKEAIRVRLLRRGAPPIEVPTLELGPPFRRRVYLAAWTPDIQTGLALDGQGRQVAHSPPVPGSIIRDPREVQLPNGSPPGAAGQGMVRDVTSGLANCQGGDPDGPTVLVAWGTAHSRTWLIAAKPPRPTENWLCWNFGVFEASGAGGVGNAAAPGIPLKPLQASGAGDIRSGGKLWGLVLGTVTTQATRVRVLFRQGIAPLELVPIQADDRFPVNFYAGFYQQPGRDTKLEGWVTKVLAYDAAGRQVAECQATAGPGHSC